jgi:hypothetical protein
VRYEASEVPFGIRDGWPEPLAEAVVTASEAGITLGGLLLSDSDWASLRASVVFTLRIDEHPDTDGYTTRHPDGTADRTDFLIPTSPVIVPATALASDREFSAWAWRTHGALGRLLVWDRSQEWWLVNEPDLEVQILCAPHGGFEHHDDPDEPFAWLPGLTDDGRDQVAYLTDRYKFDPTA